MSNYQTRRQFLASTAASTIGAAAFAVQPRAAEGDWPTKPVTMIVPYAAGATSDLLGRLFADYLGGAFGQSFVVINQAGAGGTIGSRQVQNAPPDGYTLLVSDIGSQVVAPLMLESQAYDPTKDFRHIAILGGPPLVLAVNTSLPAKNLQELKALAGGKPNGISWGSPGPGSQGHLIGELFKSQTAIPMTHVPYKGAAPAVADLAGNHIDAAFATMATVGPLIESGQLTGIAVSSEQRLPAYPNIPTFAELGLGDLTAIAWFALSAPRQLPKPLVQRLNLEVRRGVKLPSIKAVYAGQGILAMDLDEDQFAKYVEAEMGRYKPVIERLSKG
jgi:tripartite-type tricarboxylate transporter receptor subunit TctC